MGFSEADRLEARIRRLDEVAIHCNAQVAQKLGRNLAHVTTITMMRRQLVGGLRAEAPARFAPVGGGDLTTTLPDEICAHIFDMVGVLDEVTLLMHIPAVCHRYVSPPFSPFLICRPAGEGAGLLERGMAHTGCDV